MIPHRKLHIALGAAAFIPTALFAQSQRKPVLIGTIGVTIGTIGQSATIGVGPRQVSEDTEFCSQIGG